MTHYDAAGLDRPGGLAWTPAEAGAAPERPAPVAPPPPRFRRLALRLLVLLLIGVTPVAGLGLWHVAADRSAAVTEAADDALGLARALAARHALLLEEARRSLAALAADPRLASAGLRCGEALAAALADSGGALAGLAVTDAAGRRRCTAGAPVSGARAETAAAEARAAGRFASAALTPALAAGVRPRQAIAVPLAAPAGGRPAVLVGWLDPLWFSAGLTDLLTGANVRILLAGPSGRTIAAVPPTPGIAGLPLLPPEAREGEILTDARLPDIGPVLVAAAARGDGLTVAVAADRAAALAEADAALVRESAALAVATAAGLALALLAARLVLLAPLCRLCAAVASLERGETPPRLGPPFGGGRDLAALARAVDRLGRRLANREAALTTSESQLSVRSRSEERYRALADLAPEAILVAADDAVLYANARAVTLFGGDGPEDLLARPLAERLAAADRGAFAERLAQMDEAREGTVLLSDVDMIRLDGAVFRAEILAGPLAFGDRRARHVIVRDVTADRAALRRLQDSEARYRALLDTAPDFLIVHAAGRVVFANARAAETLFGITDPAGAIGRAVLDVVPPRERSRADACLSGASGRTVAGTLAVRAADGQDILCDVTSTPLTLDGRSCLYTALRARSDHSANADAAATPEDGRTARLATLGEMSADLMHELVQPLNIIRMAAETGLLDLETRPAAANEARRLSLIAGQAGRMGEMIDLIRLFTRSDPDGGIAFDAAEAARAALHRAAPELAGTEITLAADLPPAGVAWVRGRPLHLEQVLVNLIGNARDAVAASRATAAGKAWHVALTCTVSDHAVEFAVCLGGRETAESGHGRLIAPADAARRPGAGVILGLSVSRGLIRGMGGTLTVAEVEPDAGARFVLLLPRAASDAGPAPAPLPAPPPTAPGPEADDEDGDISALEGHVLLADDEVEAGALMAEFLRGRGLRVTIARSVEEAVRLFHRDPADVLVTDLRMPGGGGRVLMRRLREAVPDLAVLVVTGHAGDAEALALEDEDCVAGVLRKPVGLQDMATRIEALIDAG